MTRMPPNMDPLAVVGLKTSRGMIDAVVVWIRPVRGGRRQYLLGNMVSQRKDGFYLLSDRQADLCVYPAINKTYSLAAREAAAARTQAIYTKRQESDQQRTQARQDTLGEGYQWTDRGRFLGTDRFKIGDTITIRSDRGSWTAKVVAINTQTGKLGIPGPQVTQAVKHDLEALQIMEHLYLGKTRTRAPRDKQWIDPRAVIAVNGTPIPEGTS